MRSDRLRYTLYIYAGVSIGKCYRLSCQKCIDTGICVGFTRCVSVCVCVELQLSTKGMHMYTIVKNFKMEKKALFDGRDYEKLWIASITFFFNIS